ncbi:hypothetical protein [Companilactobacillus mishanensis]|uniref:Surface layer protein A domain-containing protein n=1 Tax=Companilactobacillus mishanensis TaxID=2486008 RepID=A0ABW9P7J9_9LACO|nr:hypothetical protein [Companilactobacillus mishanensis]MQS45240.1 hypothetical protein [Companilactobacillus mishanensis]
MKKNIKYAGITAAALLMVAPIAAPVLNASNVQTVQAASGNLQQGQQEATDRVMALMSDKDFASADAFKTSLTGMTEAGYNAKQGIDTFEKTSPIKDSEIGVIISIDRKTVNNAGVTFSVQALSATGTPYSYADYLTRVNEATSQPGNVILQINAYDSEGTQVATKNVTFSNKNVIEQAPTALNVTYTDPLNVAVNSSTSAPKYTTSVDSTVLDQNKKNIAVSTVKPSGNIYTSSASALLDDGKTDILKSQTFDQDGQTYYQKVTLLLNRKTADVSSISKGFENGTAGYAITFNGKQAIAANYDQGANSISYVRAIQVGKTTTPTPDPGNGDWTSAATKGVVTVKTSIGHLYNDDNKLTTRSLGPATDWQTDQVRTNTKTGAKQYRVSTHEWVNEADVNFNDGTVTGDGLGNVQDLGGMKTLSLDGPAGFVYTLFKTDGTNATRGLAGLSSWATDKKASDAAGNTYYRVSTDEWVRMGSGVTVK